LTQAADASLQTSNVPPQTSVCIAGGGPAGMMLGYLLARAGIDVLVLEKHADFLRDFRGDTIHPSTLEVIHELGLLEAFLARPHQELRQVVGNVAGQTVPIADFTHLPTHCKFLAFMPQWDFLDFIAGEGAKLPSFHLAMNAEATGLIDRDGVIVGLSVKTAAGQHRVDADLVVGADGRGSIVRDRAGLVVEDFGAPIDVLWMQLSHRPADPAQSFGYLARGHVFVTLDRGDYWQCAYVIPKGSAARLMEGDVDVVRRAIAGIVPWLGDRLGELRDWSDLKLLTVKVDRLREWCRPGLLCIGDAAHAMSPIGGVGINLAIQDAVATANILTPCLRARRCGIADLRRVQSRREFPTRATQRVQVALQNFVLAPALAGRGATSLPWPLRLLKMFPMLRRIPARFVGLGVRVEHVSRES
jgi:2-polyprenyl-6-methoxyphenol hydroxylase-like FAD-dependent oxidoreductase